MHGKEQDGSRQEAHKGLPSVELLRRHELLLLAPVQSIHDALGRRLYSHRPLLWTVRLFMQETQLMNASEP